MGRELETCCELDVTYAEEKKYRGKDGVQRTKTVMKRVTCREPARCGICRYCGPHCLGHKQLKLSFLPMAVAVTG